MKYKIFGLLILVGIVHNSVLASETMAKPNVIVVMTDEHNFRTLGAYRKLLSKEQANMWGPEVVKTPNLDWLANNGAMATSFYAASPVCTPSRGAFMTGMYPQNNHAYSNNKPLRDDAVTFAKILQEHGYATGYVGKWHLDGEGKPQWAPKRNFGFADNRYMFNRGHYKQYQDTATGSRVAVLDKHGQPSYSHIGADEKSFATDYQFDKVLNFIDLHKNEPFAVVLSLSDPHGPDTVRSPYNTMYSQVEFELPRTFSVDADKAPVWGKPKKGHQSMAQYYGMVKLIDDSMAKLFKNLQDNQLMDNTIIVFTSDHGDLKAEHGRQNKGVPFEGSAKVPFIVYYPIKIPSNTIVNQAMSSVDFQPTLLGLLGISGSGNEEGRDASALLTQSNDNKWQDVAFMRQGTKAKSGWLAVLSDRYKLVFSPKDLPWLFDLTKDPDELVNFFNKSAYRDIVRDMAKSLKQYANQYADHFIEHPHMQTEIDKAIAE